MNNLKLNKTDISPYAILTGNPDRVKRIAERLDKQQMVRQNREFVTCTGFFRGEKITVVSTGIGSPSAAIAIEELTSLGVHTFIRVGTSGSLQECIKPGDIVIATGAVRDEGTSPQYIPLFYPAIADHSVVAALHKSAVELGVKVYLGIVHTKDALIQETPENIPLKDYIERKWKILQAAHVLCTEMESSALFVIGSIKKVRVGAVITSAGLTYRGIPDIENQDTDKAMSNAIEIALTALGHLAKSDGELE